jgi:hypothetical protein
MAEMDIGMTHTTAANLMAVGKDGKTGRTGGQADRHPSNTPDLLFSAPSLRSG